MKQSSTSCLFHFDFFTKLSIQILKMTATDYMSNSSENLISCVVLTCVCSSNCRTLIKYMKKTGEAFNSVSMATEVKELESLIAKLRDLKSMANRKWVKLFPCGTDRIQKLFASVQEFGEIILHVFGTLNYNQVITFSTR